MQHTEQMSQCGMRNAACEAPITGTRRVERRRRFIRVIKVAGLMFTNETPRSSLHLPQTSATSIA